MYDAFTFLASTADTTDPDAGFGAFLLLVIIGILIAIFNSGNKKKEYDLHLTGRAKQR